RQPPPAALRARTPAADADRDGQGVPSRGLIAAAGGGGGLAVGRRVPGLDRLAAGSLHPVSEHPAGGARRTQPAAARARPSVRASPALEPVPAAPGLRSAR